MNLQEFNRLPDNHKLQELIKCCGSPEWAALLLKKFPFNTLDDLKNESDRIWFSLEEKNWKEAFSHHPKIGDMESLREKFSTTARWAEGEQESVKAASEETLTELKKLNELYEKKFGYIFIICATGKSAGEMLAALKERIINNPAFESRIAAQEQNKITHLRLEKLLA